MIDNTENLASQLTNESALDETGLMVMDYSRMNLFDSVRCDLRRKLGVSTD